MSKKAKPFGEGTEQGMAIFTKGTPVEVKSDKEGFTGIWFPAKIVSATAAQARQSKVFVEYQTLLSKKGNRNLREIVLMSHVRPVPPEPPVVESFKLNEAVDANHLDGWWCGFVDKVLTGNRYNVSFRDPDFEISFDFSQLRPHLDWVDGRWVKPQTNNEKVGQKRKACIDAGISENDIHNEDATAEKDDNDLNVLLLSRSKRELMGTSSLGNEEADQKRVSDIILETRSRFGRGSTKDRRRTKIPFKRRRGLANGQEGNAMEPNAVAAAAAAAEERCQNFQTDVGVMPKVENKGIDKQNDIDMTVEQMVGGNRHSRKTRNTQSTDAAGDFSSPSLDTRTPEVGSATVTQPFPTLESGSLPRSAKISFYVRRPRAFSLQESPLESGSQSAAEEPVAVDCVTDSTENENHIVPTGSSHGVPDIGRKTAHPVTTTVTPTGNGVVEKNDAAVASYTSSTLGNGCKTAHPVTTTVTPTGYGMVEENDAAVAGCKTAYPVTTTVTPTGNGMVEQNDAAVAGNTCSTLGKGKEKEIESVENQEVTVFSKNSPVWKTIECMEVFKAMPQKPHFRPLAELMEACREGVAIGHMITFATVVEKVSKLKIANATRDITSLLEPLSDLDMLGFDVKPVLDRVNKLLAIKYGKRTLMDESEDVVSRVRLSEVKLNETMGEIDDIDKQMKELEAKRESVLSKKDSISSEILGLQLRLSKTTEDIQRAENCFERLAVAPWEHE